MIIKILLRLVGLYVGFRTKGKIQKTLTNHQVIAKYCHIRDDGSIILKEPTR